MTVQNHQGGNVNDFSRYLSSSKDYVDYYIQVADDPLWSTLTDVTNLRLQLCVRQGDMTPNNSIFVKKIELLTEKTEAPPVELEPMDFNFDFLDDMQDFTFVGNPEAAKVEHNYDEMALKATMLVDGWGSIGLQRRLDGIINGADYKTVKITLKNTTGKTLTGGVSFNTVEDQTLVDNADAMSRFTVSADDGYVTHYIQLSENATWTAAQGIELVRLQIGLGEKDMVENGVVYISRIEFLRETELAEDNCEDEDEDEDTIGGGDADNDNAGTDEEIPDSAPTGVRSYAAVAAVLLMLALAAIIVMEKAKQGETA